ncbi:hypothetical protein H0H93_016458 [Arthromyces matolae]|nr:hypothetical protein H0H93_016458 [Arthromyces matolae]
MPSLTVSIEENSPLIAYDPSWRTGLSSADGAASSYSESSFMATQTAGGAASFSFNGTGVQIFGAKRGNHGPYLVLVDGTAYPPANGNAPDPGLFQQNIFTASGLQQGSHEVTITNQGTTFLDIDFLTGLGVGVSLYGPVGPDGAAYTIQLDDGPQQNYTSNKTLSRSTHELSGGVIAGITLCIVGVFGVLIGLYLFLRRNQRKVFVQEELSLSLAKEKTSDDTQPRIVTISSFGPGPSSAELGDAQGPLPIPFPESFPSASVTESGPGTLDAPRSLPVKNAISLVRPRVRLSEGDGQRKEDTVTTQSFPPGLEQSALPHNHRSYPLQRGASVASVHPRGLPEGPAPRKSNKLAAFHVANTELSSADATPTQNLSPQSTVEGRVRFVGVAPESARVMSLASEPPDYHWATHV